MIVTAILVPIITALYARRFGEPKVDAPDVMPAASAQVEHH